MTPSDLRVDLLRRSARSAVSRGSTSARPRATARAWSRDGDRRGVRSRARPWRTGQAVVAMPPIGLRRGAASTWVADSARAPRRSAPARRPASPAARSASRRPGSESRVVDPSGTASAAPYIRWLSAAWRRPRPSSPSSTRGGAVRVDHQPAVPEQTAARLRRRRRSIASHGQPAPLRCRAAPGRRCSSATSSGVRESSRLRRKTVAIAAIASAQRPVEHRSPTADGPPQVGDRDRRRTPHRQRRERRRCGGPIDRRRRASTGVVAGSGLVGSGSTGRLVDARLDGALTAPPAGWR